MALCTCELPPVPPENASGLSCEALMGGNHSCSNLKLAAAVLYLGSRVPQQCLCLSVPESSLGSCKPGAKTASNKANQFRLHS